MDYEPTWDIWKELLIAMIKLCIEDILNEPTEPEPPPGEPRQKWRLARQNAHSAREMLKPDDPIITLMAKKTGVDQRDFIAMVYEAARKR